DDARQRAGLEIAGVVAAAVVFPPVISPFFPNRMTGLMFNAGVGAGATTPHSSQSARWLVPAMLAAGVALRLHLAWLTVLNPYAALHYFVPARPSLGAVYQASLTMAHPPLMILLLHFWAKFGASEFFLRLPLVAASVGFGWVMYLWMRRIANQTAACFALALSLFLPSLISLGAEIRQYSLLLLFCALCLYALDRSLQGNSAGWMIFSGFALGLALLTQYSALIFAAAAGVYGLVRIWRSSEKVRL